ncbi:MAG: hypothetical protein IPL21_15575 [Saprospirales bacterium]|nr:hypothetical protein [Saprospirales bacterium]
MNYFFNITYFCWIFSTAQDTFTVRKKVVISAQSILLVKTTPTKQDSINFKTPKYKQGFFVILKINSTVRKCLLILV